MVFNRAMDQDPLNPDSNMNPDPAFQVNPDADADKDTDPDPIRIKGFDIQKPKKISSRNFFFLLMIKNYNSIMSQLKKKLNLFTFYSGSGYGSRTPLNPRSGSLHLISSHDLFLSTPLKLKITKKMMQKQGGRVAAFHDAMQCGAGFRKMLVG
jgi:hypothetical protein